MKILFTGCTAKQTNDDAHKRARVNRIDDSSIICNSLRKQGFIVDRREINWSTDLSEYDLAIVGLGAFGSNNYSGNIFNALHALAQVPNVLVFHEDWKIKGTMDSFNKMRDDEVFEKTISKKWSNGNNFYGGVDDPSFDKANAKIMINLVCEGYFNSLIPAFDWGNKELVRDIIKSKVIYNLDLTPYVLEHFDIPLNNITIEKKRKHMLASLVDHRPWVKRNKLKWEVDYFGAKSIEGCELLNTEKDVFNKCNEYWGILCPEYPHAGSGWFRIRYMYSAINKSIIIGSEKDLTALGLDHLHIESFSDHVLDEIARKQREKILSFMWDKETFDSRLLDIINKNSSNLLRGIEPTNNESQLSMF